MGGDATPSRAPFERRARVLAGGALVARVDARGRLADRGGMRSRAKTADAYLAAGAKATGKTSRP
jgi:hypothetical protein